MGREGRQISCDGWNDEEMEKYIADMNSVSAAENPVYRHP